MKKKLTGLCLVLALCLSTAALAADPFFPKTADMPAFTDISATGGGSDWYDYRSVKTCVEAGLMKGTGKTTFTPGGFLTLAEVAAIAARVNEKTTGYAVPAAEQGQPWYTPYLSVMAHIGVDVGKEPLAKATRADFVRMLSAVLPDTMMGAINTITTLPDSSDAAVLRFYNAGIIQGKDIYATFGGSDTLRRSETAAMVARIINPDLRVRVTPAGAVPPSELPTAASEGDIKQ